MLPLQLHSSSLGCYVVYFIFFSSLYVCLFAVSGKTTLIDLNMLSLLRLYFSIFLKDWSFYSVLQVDEFNRSTCLVMFQKPARSKDLSQVYLINCLTNQLSLHYGRVCNIKVLLCRAFLTESNISY